MPASKLLDMKIGTFRAWQEQFTTRTADASVRKDKVSKEVRPHAWWIFEVVNGSQRKSTTMAIASTHDMYDTRLAIFHGNVDFFRLNSCGSTLTSNELSMCFGAPATVMQQI